MFLTSFRPCAFRFCCALLCGLSLQYFRLMSSALHTVNYDYQLALLSSSDCFRWVRWEVWQNLARSLSSLIICLLVKQYSFSQQKSQVSLYST